MRTFNRPVSILKRRFMFVFDAEIHLATPRTASEWNVTMNRPAWGSEGR
ncbi:hypothetical protein E2C01_052538 [Portunus trituberculatus]|uniref:Uncharacterized protein n=1 Tax=Portunus trituberculatus TaxID=210409 RepID=A0A5B7GHY3_PORTR|nr:hypothetical protein [Portunus trituberculatus]